MIETQTRTRTGPRIEKLPADRQAGREGLVASTSANAAWNRFGFDDRQIGWELSYLLLAGLRLAGLGWQGAVARSKENQPTRA